MRPAPHEGLRSCKMHAAISEGPTRLLAHVERTLSAQAEFPVKGHALAGTDFAVHNLGRIAWRGQTAKNLRTYEEYLGPCAFAGLDQRAVVIIEAVILAALTH